MTKNEDLKALLPCPFCNGEAEQLNGIYVKDVQCKKCGSIADTDKWNSRPTPTDTAMEDAVYKERNQVVAALAKCFPSGFKKTTIEGWDEAWHNCVYIDLPTGQASWHYHDRDAYLFDGLPPYAGEWDGHTTPEKYDRLHALKSSATDGDAEKEIDTTTEKS